MNFVLPIGAGLVVGFLIGLTGMGGGALMTPFLLLVMKLNPVTAIGTDLVFAAITKIAGGAQHYRHGNTSIKHVTLMAFGSLPASLLSAQFVLRLEPHLVQTILPFAVGSVLIMVGGLIFAQVQNWIRSRETAELQWPPSWALVFIGIIGGALVGMTSVGGGTVIMAMLMIFFALPVNFLVGLDVLHGALLATIAALSYIYSGQTDWSLVGLLIIGSLPGAWLGARSVNRLDRRTVRIVLSILIVGAGINLLWYH